MVDDVRFFFFFKEKKSTKQQEIGETWEVMFLGWFCSVSLFLAGFHICVWGFARDLVGFSTAWFCLLFGV